MISRTGRSVPFPISRFGRSPGTARRRWSSTYRNRWCTSAFSARYAAERTCSSTSARPRVVVSRRYLLRARFRDMMSGKNYKCKVSAADKVVIVTGANTGIGKEAARLLAIKNATVVMACRDMDKCEKVKNAPIPASAEAVPLSRQTPRSLSSPRPATPAPRTRFVRRRPRTCRS